MDWSGFGWVFGGVVIVVVKYILEGWVRSETFALHRDGPCGCFEEFRIGKKKYRVRSPSKCKVRYSDIKRQIRIFEAQKGYVAKSVLDKQRSAYWEYLRRNTEK